MGLEKKKTGNMKKPGLSSEENNAVVGKNEALAGESKGFLKQKKAAGREKKTASSGGVFGNDDAVAVENKKSSGKEGIFNSNAKNTFEDALSESKTDGTLLSGGKNDAFKDFKNVISKKDSVAVAKNEEPNALEELLKKNEEEKKTIAAAKMDRWQISSNVAPIYFSSASNGSPIDGQFSENSKSYENNLSFGLGVNYAVNKKISVRTGVNKFTLGYNTNDIVFFAALDQAGFSNLATSNAGSTIQVISMNNTEAMRPFDSSIQNTNEGVMTQKMGYFEVPMEVSYKLVDKKFGIDVIGGVSTLFLNENEVSVSSSLMSASLGKANNLNDIHFSTNVGLGFRYRFWKSFEANFEPMFKYQINTFNKDDGNFKPYFVGLYSGVSFKF